MQRSIRWFRNGPYPVPEVQRQQIGSIEPCDCDVATPASARCFGQLLAHQPMQQVDRLERAHHHLEMRDPAVVAEGDDVDAVDLDALDLVFEFEHRAVVAAPFADIGEARAAQHLFGARQIFEGDVAAALRRVHDGAFEHRVGMQQIPQRRGGRGTSCSRTICRGRSWSSDVSCAARRRRFGRSDSICTLTHMHLYA